MEHKNKIDALVVHYFLTEKNNTTKIIAEKLDIKISRISGIIDKYLKTKIIG